MNRIRELREKRNLTQDAIAKFLNINRNTVSRYETGGREPDYETLKKLALFFETSTSYLIGEIDDPTPQNKTKEAIPPLGSEEWLRNGLAARGIKELTDKQLEFLLKNIDFMANQLTDGGE